MTNLSINTFNESPWVGGSADLGGWVEGAARAGFSLIGPDAPSLAAWIGAGHSLAALKRQMRDAGIGCGVIAAAALLDGTSAQLDQLLANADHADALGAGMLQVNVAASDAAARVDAVAAAADLLDGRNLRLAIEYMPISPLATLAETLAIVDAVGRDRAGALVDIWHHTHDPSGWEAIAAAPLEAIAYLEFDDAQAADAAADLTEETMHRRTFPGCGVLDCARFAEVWRAKGYDGFVSVEVLDQAWRGRPIADFARASYLAAAPYWP
ncbi:MAG: TIM barrel protein [Sphingomonadales bacterium]|nr:TIM barrel protein [Sphingomonadales bacterium]